MEDEATPYISEKNGIVSVSEAIAGACDIIAEFISDSADYRTWIREKTFKRGSVRSVAKDVEAKSPMLIRIPHPVHHRLPKPKRRSGDFLVKKLYRVAG